MFFFHSGWNKFLWTPNLFNQGLRGRGNIAAATPVVVVRNTLLTGSGMGLGQLK